MRFFVWVDFQYQILALFSGTIALILVYMAWASYQKKRREISPEEISEKRGHEHEAGFHYEKIPIAPFIIFTYVMIAAWTLAYMLYSWLSNARY